MKESLKNQIVIEATHISEVYGPAQALRNYLKKRIGKFFFITHPFPYTSLKRSRAVFYQKGRLKDEFIGPKNITLEILHYLRDTLFTFRSVWRLKRKADLFIGVNNLNAFVGIWLRRLRKVKKVIYYVIDYTPKRFSNILLNLIYHRIDHFCIRHADYIWNLSERMAQVRRRQGVPEEKNMIVPVGVELEKIRLLPLNQIERRTLVIMSYLIKSKGIQLAIESMDEISQKISEAKLIIIGTGPYEDELRKMVAEKGLKEKINFLGPMEHDELFEFLPKCGIALATYTEDPNNVTYYADPTKPKEYLACGLPLVITRVPWIAQEVEKRKMGIAINYKKEELVNAIIKLLSDDEFYMECRKNAIEFVSNLNWSRIYEEAFKKTNNRSSN